MSLYRNVKPSHIRAIRKKYNLREDQNLSSSQFRELLEMGLKGASSSKDETFLFSYDISPFLESDESDIFFVRITLAGRHLAKNRYDALTRKKQFSYIRAIKNAAEEARLKYRKMLNELCGNGSIPLPPSFVYYYPHNPVSRDHDANSETIKRLQDTFTSLGIIHDDRREFLRLGDVEEVLIPRGEQWKIVADIVPQHCKSAYLKRKKEEGYRK
jgi:hypothetical protein